MSGPLEIIIAAEDESDARRVRILIDRLLCDADDWVREDPAQLDHLRRWRGETEASGFVDIHKIHDLAKARRIPMPLGKFGELYDLPLIRRFLLMMQRAEARPHAIVWIRDTDGDLNRGKAWDEARSKFVADFMVLLGGFPHECMEAWLLTTWANGTHYDDERVAGPRRQLGFNPATQPHLLSHKTNVPKSAKAIVSALAVEGDETFESCDLQALLAGDDEAGLAAFLRLVREQLIPAVRQGPSDPS
ncbi:MAG: hypothetical protein HC927_13145 [Deltaproteobacteria bacterium]|nr:hypothetical protein [Deltaproteobacteria bacterium]